MAKNPAILWYPSDWDSGTKGMSFEEKGAYMELLMTQFSRGHMTTDMIGRLVGRMWGQIKDKFILDDDGLWYNERMDEEILKRKKFVTSRYNNKLGKNQYNKDVGHMTSHMENDHLVVKNTVETEKNENKSRPINFAAQREGLLSPGFARQLSAKQDGE